MTLTQEYSTPCNNTKNAQEWPETENTLLQLKCYYFDETLHQSENLLK